MFQELLKGIDYSSHTTYTGVIGLYDVYVAAHITTLVLGWVGGTLQHPKQFKGLGLALNTKTYC